MKIKSLIRNSLLVAAVILIPASCVKNMVSQGFDWPQWRGPDGNSISKEIGWNPNALNEDSPKIWRTNVGIGYSNVAIKDNRLYTMGQKFEKKGVFNIIFCLDARSGKLFWKYALKSDGGPQSTPTVEGDRVYTLSKKGIMACLYCKNGRLQWRKDLALEYSARAPYYGFTSSPVVVGELVVLTSNSAGMALNKHTGELVWQSALPPEERYPDDSTGIDYSTPVVYTRGGNQYAIISGYDGIHSVDVQTGEQLWHYDWGKYPTFIGNQVADPLIIEDKLFIAEYYSQHPGAFLLDIGGEDLPKLIWVNQETCSNNGSPVALDGYIYVCQDGIQTNSGSLRCLDLRNGELLWEEELEKKAITLTASDGKLIILDAHGRIFIAEASPHKYKEISRYAIPNGKMSGNWWTSPVLCGGRIYCRSSYGDIVCIDVSM